MAAGMRGGVRKAPQGQGSQSNPLTGNSSSFNGVQMGVPATKPSHPSVGGKVKVIGEPTKVVRNSGGSIPARHSPDTGKMLSK